MRMSWGLFFALMWVYRSAFSYLGQAVVANLTTLGDSSKFQGTQIVDRNLDVVAVATNVVGIRSFSTVVTEYVGAGLSRVLFQDPVLVNVGFQTIAFVGIVAFLMSLRSQYRVLAAAILLLPSFTLWSSIASKEAIVVLGVGLVAAFVVKQFRRERRSFLLLIFGLLIIAIFKNHYLPAILFLTFGIAISRQVKQIEFLAFAALVMSFAPLYLLHERIAATALSILPHFLGVAFVARSTREAFWQTPGEVYTKAAEGMALSFFGPTPAEAASGLLQMASFLESSLLVGGLVVVLFWRLPRVPLFSFFLGLGALFWILFANYPFGVMNAGGAVRYRTGYEMIVILIVVFLFSRSTYLDWRRPGQTENAEPEPAATVSASPSP